MKMRPIANWENVKAAGERRKLPAGGYLCRIMGAAEKTYSGSNGSYQKLEISIDIADGEYQGFYAEDYRNQTAEDKRWKGVLRLTVPTGDGTDQDEWAQRKLKAVVEAIEDSNADYHWDWDETKLKGKMVGCLFQNREWEFKGKTGWTAQAYAFISVDDLLEKKFTVPKDKPLNAGNAVVNFGGSVPASFNAPDLVITDDDLPF
jgi:hypothetical protein